MYSTSFYYSNQVIIMLIYFVDIWIISSAFGVCVWCCCVTLCLKYSCYYHLKVYMIILYVSVIMLENDRKM